MSDQTPPPGEPAITPTEGAADDHQPGDAAPPAPPVPPTDTTVSEPPPPPPATKSRKGLIVSIVAALVVLALVGGALAVFFATRGPDTHSITIKSTAGGMKRDKAGEAKLRQQLDATTKQFETQFKGTTVKAALFKQEKSSRGPTGQLLFLSFKFKTPSEKNPAKILDQLKTIAKSNQLKVTKVSTGDAGGKAVCLGRDGAQKTASCLWVTRDTAGGLFPNNAGYDPKKLSKIMTALRADVEKTN